MARPTVSGPSTNRGQIFHGNNCFFTSLYTPNSTSPDNQDSSAIKTCINKMPFPCAGRMNSGTGCSGS